MEPRLRVQMHRAFFDHLKSKLDAEDKSDAIAWLVRLHDELGKRFKAVLPSKRTQIDEHFDSTLFAQQLTARAYGYRELGPLVECTWGLLRMACAPDMDVQLQEAYTEVKAALVPGAAFSVTVPLYLRLAHGQLDEIIRRIEELRA